MMMPNPPPTLGDIATTWTPSPVADLLMAIATVGYATLLYRHLRNGERWPISRTVCWCAAMASLVVAANSAMAVYSHDLFWVHMLVHLMMIMVAPALLVWAQPIRLTRDAGGLRAGAVIDRVRAATMFRVLVSPWLTVPLYAAVIALTHLTGFQQAMTAHMWIHDVELVMYLLSGYLLLLPMLGDELGVDPPLPHFLRFVVLAICMGPDTLVGVTLMMSPTVLAPGFAAARAWGPTALSDQTAAGAVMWFGGDGLMMVLMVIVAGRWVRAGDGARSLGPWLDGIRQRSTLGETDYTATGIDDEQAALDAYNARLAHLHGRNTRREASTESTTSNGDQ